MNSSKIKQFLEPIGLVLLLFAFGWQCWEEHANQNKYEGYIYELNLNIMSIWSGVYDEALHSERYKGEAMVFVDYDVLNRSMKNWEQIQEEFQLINKQTSFFFQSRVVLYILGSLLVVFGKWPQKMR